MSYQTAATFYPGGDDSYFMPEIVQPAPHRVADHPTNMPQNVAHMEQSVSDASRSFTPVPQHGNTPGSAPLGSTWGNPTADQNHGSNWQNSQTTHNASSYAQGNLPQNGSWSMPTNVTSTIPPLVSPQLNTPGSWDRNSQYQNQTYNNQAISNPQPQNYQPPNYNMPTNSTSQPPLFQDQQHAPRPSSASQVYQRPEYQSTSHGLSETPNFSPFPKLRNPGPNIPPTDEEKESKLDAVRADVLASNDIETQLIWAQDALTFVEIAQQNEQRVCLTQPARPRTPRIEHALREDALKVVNFLADQHHPKADFIRGMWLEFGKFGHRIDKKEAYYSYCRASEKGYARADYRIGMQFESSNDALKAVKYYQKGVDAGDSASSYRLGMMILLGQHGQVQDYERGLRLIHASAQTADENAPQGCYVLGMLQAHEMPQINIPEHYLPKDLTAARGNIEKAAYLGFAKAQLKMGAAYELSELGCNFDPALSLHYNALAARQGEMEAEMAISKWFLCGSEGVFAKNDEMAFTYAQRAAVSNLDTAQFAMGYLYEVGIYVKVNYDTAKEWYEKAAQNGNRDASKRIEAITRSRTLSKADHENIALEKLAHLHRSPTTAGTDSHPAPIAMPDPSRLSLNTTTTARPASAAPYPVAGPNMPSANFSNPEFRPTSAFGINPRLGVNPGLPPRADSYNHSAPQQRYQQRYGSEGSIADGYGHGRPANSGSPAPVRYQIPPGQDGPRPRYSSNNLQPGGPQIPPKQSLSSPNATSPLRPGQMDIGFAAPPDPSMAAREERYARPPEHYRRTPVPPAAPPVLGSIPAPRPDSRPRPDQRPSQGGSPINARPNGFPSQSQQHQQNTNSRPAQQQIPSQQRPPPKQQNSNLNVRPARINPTKLPSNAPSPHTAPPKPNTVSPNAVKPSSRPNGPQTFDEMGIPAGKNKRDCIVM